MIRGQNIRGVKRREAGARSAIELGPQELSPEVQKMRDTVRCPYCVSGSEIFAMVVHVDGRYICGKCGHTAYPDDAAYSCRCPKCLELADSRMAS